MNIQKYLDDMKKIQTILLDYLEYEENIEEYFQNLKDFLNDINIQNNQHEFKSFLHLLVKISNNHYRGIDFYTKIEHILRQFKDTTKKYFSNSEIFNIFKRNKKILLFLIEENILLFDKYISKRITAKKYLDMFYPQYFAPEIKPFLTEILEKKEYENSYEKELYENLLIELPENFYEKRKIGENDDYICKLIRNDMIEDFIIYVNKNFYSLKATVNPSIFETNISLLRKENLTLIEYTTFYGSIQIFNYLRLNGVELTSSLCIYSIHGQNAEIIHFLEENFIKTESEYYYIKLLNESIKCHHVDITNYIQNNYLPITNANTNCILHNYNFIFMENDYINESNVYSICIYDYYLLFSKILNEYDININMHDILDTTFIIFKIMFL